MRVVPWTLSNNW